MTIASGIAKQLRYKEEVTWGTAPGASGGQLLRRISSDLDIRKNTYQSNEIRSDYQISDFRHGTRRVEGNINGEMSPGTYKDFFAALLRKAFVATTAISGASITIAGAGPYTITRAAGSFLTDGIKIGDVVRLTAGSFNAANLNKNFYVTGVVALVLTGYPLNGVAMVAEGPIAAATVSVPGKRVWVPTSSHTDKSFSIEHYFSDLVKSELFTGCKVASASIQLPATGNSTVNMSIMGKGVTTGTAEYYTTPTAETTTGVLTAVSGKLLASGTAIATVTGASLDIAGNYSNAEVVGSNESAAVFPGRVIGTGQFQAYFEDTTFRDAFLNETELSLVLYLTTGSGAADDFISIVVPRLKVGGASKSDGETGIIQTIPFQALLNSAGGTGVATEKTTILIQDSQA